MSLMMASSASPDVRMMPAYSRCSGREVGVQQQAGHADDAVHRGADLMAHVGEKSLLARLAASASFCAARNRRVSQKVAIRASTRTANAPSRSTE